MNTELFLLKLFFDFECYTNYSKFLKREFIKDNSKELFKLYEAVSLFHQKFPSTNISSVSDFEVFYYACYPATNAKDKTVLEPLFKKLTDINPQPEIATEVIRNHIERVRATEIGIIAVEVSEGKKPFSDLQTALASIEAVEASEEEFVTDDLEDLLNSTIVRPGLRWRLDSMNKHLGSLRQGDFGFVFKRPETGGTTFLASEVSHMATQTDGDIVWFNNEEQGKKVKLRVFQAFFGTTTDKLRSDWKRFNDEYQKRVGQRIRIVDSATLHRRDVERILAATSPALILFDQLDKVKGFTSDRDDLELKAKYQWAREIAKSHAPVIGISQASVSAEGKKYLTMDDVDGSKTGKQGEADWILGIGKSHNLGAESIRYFNLCKNKLAGDTDTIAERRHWGWETLIQPDIARYRDIR